MQRSHRGKAYPLDQKSTRALNVIVRFPVAVVMRPKFVELMLVVGLPHKGLFNALTASARIVKLLVSSIRIRLLNAISRPRLPGPRRKFSAVFPAVPGAGF